MGYNTKCSVFGSAMAQLKLCFSFKFNPLWFPFSVFIFQVMLHKRTQMMRNAFEYWEPGISKKPKLFSKQYKVHLIFQYYLILTINRVCYSNLSPPLFWILCWKNKQTNTHPVTTVLYSSQLSQTTWHTVVWFTNVAKAFHCLSIKGEIICKMQAILHFEWILIHPCEI